VNFRTVREDDVLRQDVIDRLAVQHGAGAARVVGHHAADRGPIGRGDVWCEPEAVRAQRDVELVEHDARFDARPPFGGVDLEQAVEVLRRVDLQAGANRLSRLRCPAAAHRHRAAELTADPHGLDDVGARLHDDDADWFDLVDAGVSGVERAGHVVEAHFALEAGFKRAPQAVDIDSGSSRVQEECRL
jgi:hypothetical protein